MSVLLSTGIHVDLMSFDKKNHTLVTNHGISYTCKDIQEILKFSIMNLSIIAAYKYLQYI